MFTCGLYHTQNKSRALRVVLERSWNVLGSSPDPCKIHRSMRWFLRAKTVPQNQLKPLSADLQVEDHEVRVRDSKKNNRAKRGAHFSWDSDLHRPKSDHQT